jgi:hypothetical protein
VIIRAGLQSSWARSTPRTSSWLGSNSSVMGTLDFTDRDEPTPSTDRRQLLTERLDYPRHQQG